MGKSPGLRLQASIVQDNIPTEILPGLFVGSVHTAFNIDALKEHKISHILNLAGNYATFPDDFIYLSMNIRDKEYSNLLSCIPIATIFIEAGIKHGGVLVHCAGGRSRSPAIIMSYLMIRDSVSYNAAFSQVKELRPVISLNAGFEAQLKMLEKANGDVFCAHQFLLQHTMSVLAQQRRDGSFLDKASLKKRRQQHQQPFPCTPRSRNAAANTNDSSTCSTLASCCDERGMLDGKIPSGFCLSVPTNSKLPQFIPALRSMGTLFGCKACGKHLFCSSAIIQVDTDKGECTQGKDGDHNETHSQDISAELQVAAKSIENRIVTMGETHGETSIGPTSDAETKKNKPLLAKLRLRPQKLNISKPGLLTEVKTANSAPSTPVAFLKTERPIQLERALTPNSRHVGNVLRSLKREILTSNDLKSGSKVDKFHPSSTTKKNNFSQKSTEGFWRALASFKASKRIFKESSSEKHRASDSTSELKKAVKGSIETDGGDTPLCSDAQWAQRPTNPSIWENCIYQIISCSNREDNAIRYRMATVIDADAMIMEALTSKEQWSVESQPWFLDDVQAGSNGVIHCPNADCHAIVGEYRWEDTRCTVGELITPMFQINKTAIQLQGILTSQPDKVTDYGVSNCSSSFRNGRH